MNDVKVYAFTLLCAALLSALLELAADEKQKKQISYITGLFMLICVAAPFTKVIDMAQSFSLRPNNSEVITIDTDRLLENELSARLEKIIADKLAAIGILDADIGIEITVSEQDVNIGTVRIALPTEYSGEAEKAGQFILDELGLAAEIQISGG